jgi:hypothetical protein
LFPPFEVIADETQAIRLIAIGLRSIRTVNCAASSVVIDNLSS